MQKVWASSLQRLERNNDVGMDSTMKSGGVESRGAVRGGVLSGVSTIAALDVGSTKITCAIAEYSPAKRRGVGDVRSAIKIVGFGQTAARGVKSGTVNNVDEAERAIRLAVDAAERMAQRRIRSVYVGVSGGRPQSIVVAGGARSQTGIVSPRDADNAVSDAISRINVGKRHVLHLMPIGFGLDGVSSGDTPLGLHGMELLAELAVVTVDAAAMRNLEIVVERSHLQVAGFALTPYAAARGALVQDELSLGTILIDMGGATSSFSLFKDGKLAGAGILPIGGNHVTQDVAQGLSTTLAHAERMKTMFGTVLPNGHDEREMLAVPLLGERGVDTVQKVPKQVLTSIIRPRLEETFDLMQQRLAEEGRFAASANRVVLTGGASQLQGVADLAAHVLGRPVRLGMPASLAGMPDVGRGPGFSVLSGLLACAAEPDRTYAMPQEAQDVIDRSQLTYTRRLGRWLAESL